MNEQNNTAQEKDVVVVVDDDPAVCSSLEFSLQVEGFDVQTYASGTELLNAGKLPARGCVIIDYFLPGMNGLELALALRARRVSLPVILITTHPNRSLRQTAAAEGIEIVEKPLLGNLLSERIRAAVRHGSSGASPT
jgi:two-component system, LuxR family, response regulator FixJ